MSTRTSIFVFTNFLLFLLSAAITAFCAYVYFSSGDGMSLDGLEGADKTLIIGMAYGGVGVFAALFGCFGRSRGAMTLYALLIVALAATSIAGIIHFRNQGTTWPEKVAEVYDALKVEDQKRINKTWKCSGASSCAKRVQVFVDENEKYLWWGFGGYIAVLVLNLVLAISIGGAARAFKHYGHA